MLYRAKTMTDVPSSAGTYGRSGIDQARVAVLLSRKQAEADRDEQLARLGESRELVSQIRRLEETMAGDQIAARLVAAARNGGPVQPAQEHGSVVYTTGSNDWPGGGGAGGSGGTSAGCSGNTTGGAGGSGGAAGARVVISVPASEVEIHGGKAYVFCDPDSHDSCVGPFEVVRQEG